MDYIGGLQSVIASKPSKLYVLDGYSIQHMNYVPIKFYNIKFNWTDIFHSCFDKSAFKMTSTFKHLQAKSYFTDEESMKDHQMNIMVSFGELSDGPPTGVHFGMSLTW